MNTNRSRGIITKEVLFRGSEMNFAISAQSLKSLHKAEPLFVEGGELYANTGLIIPVGAAVEEYCAAAGSKRKQAKIRSQICDYMNEFTIRALFYGFCIGAEAEANQQSGRAK